MEIIKFDYFKTNIGAKVVRINAIFLYGLTLLHHHSKAKPMVSLLSKPHYGDA